MPRTTAARPFPVTLFADAFALTAVDPRGRARSRAPKEGCTGFDAKAPFLLVYGAVHGATVVDAALRPVGGRSPSGSALLPDGAALVASRSADGVFLQAGDRAPQTVAAPPVTRSLAPAPAGSPSLSDLARLPVLARDGGFALACADGVVRFGHLDVAGSAVSSHVDVTTGAAPGARRAFLPGRGEHVVATLDVARGALRVAVIGADGALEQREHGAVGLPARDGDALWWQRDEGAVVVAGVDGRERAVYAIPDEHRGAGEVFAQGGEGCFVPWHGEVVIALSRGATIDRALPPDAGARRHVAEVLRRLRGAGRAAGLGIELRELRVSRGAQPSVWTKLGFDGGDEGPLAHSVTGAAATWGAWSSPAGHRVASPDRAVVIRARTAELPELLAALAALDAHGLALRDAAAHWEQVCAFARHSPFTDASAEAFLGALLAGEVGAQRAAGERAAAAPLGVTATLAALTALKGAVASWGAVAMLACQVLARHRRADALAVMDALVGSGAKGAGSSFAQLRALVTEAPPRFGPMVV